MKSLNHYKKEAGVTLVELMVGLSVGFIVIGGIITIYSNTAGSSASTIRGAILNQEMHAIMQLVSNDIRRAGYWEDPTPGDPTDTNPFTSAYNITIGTWEGKSCVTYAYDLDPTDRGKVGIGGNYLSGTSPASTDGNGSEVFGFRYDTTNKAIEMRNGGTPDTGAVDCTDTNGSWEALNDSTVVTITELSFDTAGTSCINTTTTATPNNWTTDNTATKTTTFCSESDNAKRDPDVAVAADDSVTEIRQVNITLTGELSSDSSVTMSLSRAIRVRNNRSITGLTITVP